MFVHRGNESLFLNAPHLGHDLLKWDTVHNVTLKSLADGVEELSIQGLISPPTGPSLLSAVGDEDGQHYCRSFCTCNSSGFIMF